LTTWYSAVFILSFLCLFILAYLFLNASYREQDQVAVSGYMGDLLSLYLTGGMPLIEREVNVEKKFGQNDRFFVRIADDNNNTIFLNIPYQWADFDIKALEGRRPPAADQWIRLPAAEGGNYLEVTSLQMPDGYWLQVGKTIEERLKMLQRFRKSFLAVVFPLVLFGLIGGAVFSFRALRPIRHLIQTVQSIDVDQMAARVPNPHSGDELDELVQLFNDMLYKIETLIRAMRGSLDHVAHDLRTPMTRLRGIAEMALRDENADPHSLREALADCIEESERVLTLLNTLMDISEAETGTLALNRQPVPLGEMLDRVAELYGIVAEEKGVDLQVTSPEGLTAVVDRTRMGQALANLLDNAVKYTPAQGVIRMDARADGPEIIITVKDTGLGIPPLNLPRIWDRLYRGDQSRSQKGLGLGLSLVKAIVEAHGGRIEVNSRPGEGSCFIVRLPQQI